MAGQQISGGTFQAYPIVQGGGHADIRSATDEYLGRLGMDTSQVTERTLLWPMLGDSGYAFTYESGGDPEWQLALARAAETGRRIQVTFEVI